MGLPGRGVVICIMGYLSYYSYVHELKQIVCITLRLPCLRCVRALSSLLGQCI